MEKLARDFAVMGGAKGGTPTALGTPPPSTLAASPRMAHRPERSVRQAHSTNDWPGATPSTGMWMITDVQRESCPPGQNHRGGLAPSMIITHHAHVHATLLGPPAPAWPPCKSKPTFETDPRLRFPSPSRKVPAANDLVSVSGTLTSQTSAMSANQMSPAVEKSWPYNYIDVYVTPRNNTRSCSSMTMLLLHN